MIGPATLYKMSTILTDYYADDNQNTTIWTAFTDQHLYHRYYGINSPTHCNILKHFYCVLITDKDNEEYRFCVQYWINVSAFAALLQYNSNLHLQDVKFETDDILEWVQL